MAQPIDSAAPQFGNEGSVPAGMNAVMEAQNTTTSSQQVSHHLQGPTTSESRTTYQQTTTTQGPMEQVSREVVASHNYMQGGSSSTYQPGMSASYQGGTSYQGGAASSASYQQGAYHQGALVGGVGMGGATAATSTTTTTNTRYGQNSYTTGGAGYQAGTSAVYSTGGEISYSAAGQSQGVYSSNQVIRGTSGVTEHSRVIGHEYGQERIVSVTQHVDESRASIISERFVEYEIKVPKKIVREEVIETVVVRPDIVRLEETIEEVQKVREKIVEIAKPTIVEKVVEIPEIEWIERIVEIPEKILQEKIQHVEKVEVQERMVPVNKVIVNEKIREVPEYIYRDVPVERVVEIPEYREEVVIREIPVPQYVDKPIPQEVQVEKFVDLERKIPVPVEAIVAYEYRMPRIKPRYSKVTYPVYLPRFIEIPVAVDLLNAGLLSHAENYLNQVQSLTRSATSLCEIEGLAAQIMKADLQSQLQSVDLQAAVLKAWQSNTIGATTMTTTTTTQQQQYTGGITANYTSASGASYTAAIGGGATFATSTMTPLTGGQVVSVTREHKKSKKSSKHRV